MSTNKFSKFHLHSLKDLDAEPHGEWLIDGVVEAGAQAVLYGAPGHGKTFLAVDWALCVATGRPWCGRKVNEGHVIYVTGESWRGLFKRVSAWCWERGVSPFGTLHIVREPVQLPSGDDVELLLQQIENQNVAPKLIILDTLARCSVGADENSSQHMGVVVEKMRQLSEKTGATVIPVHHTSKNNQTERGSGALRGAADVMILLEKMGDMFTVTNDKQKEAEEFDPIRMRLKGVDVLRPDRQENSCVLIPVAKNESQVELSVKSPMNESLKQAALVLASFTGQTATTGEWRKALGTEEKEVSTKTLDNWRKALVESGHVEKTVEGGYRLTEKGTNAIGVPLASQSGVSSTLATPHPL